MTDILWGVGIGSLIIFIASFFLVDVDDRPNRTVRQAQLDTLYAQVDSMHADVKRVTEIMNAFCLELAVEHQMGHEQAHEFCDE